METDPLEEKNNANNSTENSSPIEENLTPRQIKARRREEVLDKIFGTYRPANFENIWGNKLPVIGFFLIIGLSIFAYWGTQKGIITWEKDDADMPSLFRSQKDKKAENKDSVQTINMDNKDIKKD